MGETVTIFSSLDDEYRDVRAKGVAHSSPQLKTFRSECKSRRVKLDILDRRLSLDVVTGYLLNERYGGLTGHKHLRRLSLLPNWLFRILYSLSSRISSREAVGRCIAAVYTFAQRLVSQAVTDDPASRHHSYQSRLLAAGIAPAEVLVQCQAVVFAGTDSTGRRRAKIALST
ncbi:hypothetical protein VPNG_08652 [Cytospora leucostoma]|uniref:Uncharacterized protein n=1 Tax=Cytospora leucostoma TaxID=1230097 RepID=A0A423W3B5_9PEZI|nr:hypothetical protein VPNG_08652 [Cytospora leucostoma]